MAAYRLSKRQATGSIPFACLKRLGQFGPHLRVFYTCSVLNLQALLELARLLYALCTTVPTRPFLGLLYKAVIV